MSKGNIVITGGTKGLGGALARLYATKGYTVLALYSSDEEAAQQIEEFGECCEGTITSLHSDIRSADTPNRTINALQDFPGPITLINNAVKVFHPKAMHQVTPQEIRDQWEVTVFGNFFLSISLAKEMVKRKSGTIVNILSQLVETAGVKGFSSYLLAKHSLLGLTKAQATELSPLSIRVFAVSPPFMNTHLTQSWSKHLVNSLNDSLKITPEQVATKIFQLATDPNTPAKGENHKV
jgi:NAD(P)-dependent dehydrogenase (short-subunit alcohol dehydrogenase family)